MLQRYEPRPTGLAVRLAATARDLARTTPAGYTRIVGRAAADLRAGAPLGRVVLGVAGGSLRLGAQVLETAQRHDLPGTARAGRAVERARERLAPFAELIDAPAVEPQPRRTLRDTGRDLLHRSTALDDCDEHPAYRQILDGLAPDEARILRYLARHGATPLIDVVEHDRARGTTRPLCHHLSFIGPEAGCLRPGLAPVYLDNLARLGVVYVRNYPVAGEEAYELLAAQPEVESLPRARGPFVRRKVVRKGVELSPFGRSFYEICFS